MMAQEEPADGVDVGQQAADPEPAQATSTGGNGPGKEQSASHILNLEKHVLHADILRAGAQLVLQEPSPPKRKGKKLVSRTVLEMLVKASAELEAVQKLAEEGIHPLLPKAVLPQGLTRNRGKGGLGALLRKLRLRDKPDERVTMIGGVRIGSEMGSSSDEDDEEGSGGGGPRRRSLRPAASAIQVLAGKKKAKKSSKPLLWRELVAKRKGTDGGQVSQRGEAHVVVPTNMEQQQQQGLPAMAQGMVGAEQSSLMSLFDGPPGRPEAAAGQPHSHAHGHRRQRDAHPGHPQQQHHPQDHAHPQRQHHYADALDPNHTHEHHHHHQDHPHQHPAHHHHEQHPHQHPSLSPSHTGIRSREASKDHVAVSVPLPDLPHGAMDDRRRGLAAAAPPAHQHAPAPLSQSPSMAHGGRRERTVSPGLGHSGGSMGLSVLDLSSALPATNPSAALLGFDETAISNGVRDWQTNPEMSQSSNAHLSPRNSGALAPFIPGLGLGQELSQGEPVSPPRRSQPGAAHAPMGSPMWPGPSLRPASRQARLSTSSSGQHPGFRLSLPGGTPPSQGHQVHHAHHAHEPGDALDHAQLEHEMHRHVTVSLDGGSTGMHGHPGEAHQLPAAPASAADAAAAELAARMVGHTAEVVKRAAAAAVVKMGVGQELAEGQAELMEGLHGHVLEEHGIPEAGTGAGGEGSGEEEEEGEGEQEDQDQDPEDSPEEAAFLKAAVLGQGPYTSWTGGCLDLQLELLMQELYEGHIDAPSRPGSPVQAEVLMQGMEEVGDLNDVLAEMPGAEALVFGAAGAVWGQEGAEEEDGGLLQQSAQSPLRQAQQQHRQQPQHRQQVQPQYYIPQQKPVQMSAGGAGAGQQAGLSTTGGMPPQSGHGSMEQGQSGGIPGGGLVSRQAHGGRVEQHQQQGEQEFQADDQAFSGPREALISQVISHASSMRRHAMWADPFGPGDGGLPSLPLSPGAVQALPEGPALVVPALEDSSFMLNASYLDGSASPEASMSSVDYLAGHASGPPGQVPTNSGSLSFPAQQHQQHPASFPGPLTGSLSQDPQAHRAVPDGALPQTVQLGGLGSVGHAGGAGREPGMGSPQSSPYNRPGRGVPEGSLLLRSSSSSREHAGPVGPQQDSYSGPEGSGAPFARSQSSIDDVRPLATGAAAGGSFPSKALVPSLSAHSAQAAGSNGSLAAAVTATASASASAADLAAAAPSSALTHQLSGSTSSSVPSFQALPERPRTVAVASVAALAGSNIPRISALLQEHHRKLASRQRGRQIKPGAFLPSSCTIFGRTEATKTSHQRVIPTIESMVCLSKQLCPSEPTWNPGTGCIMADFDTPLPPSVPAYQGPLSGPPALGGSAAGTSTSTRGQGAKGLGPCRPSTQQVREGQFGDIGLGPGSVATTARNSPGTPMLGSSRPGDSRPRTVMYSREVGLGQYSGGSSGTAPGLTAGDGSGPPQLAQQPALPSLPMPSVRGSRGGPSKGGGDGGYGRQLSLQEGMLGSPQLTAQSSSRPGSMATARSMSMAAPGEAQRVAHSWDWTDARAATAAGTTRTGRTPLYDSRHLALQLPPGCPPDVASTLRTKLGGFLLEPDPASRPWGGRGGWEGAGAGAETEGARVSTASASPREIAAYYKQQEKMRASGGGAAAAVQARGSKAGTYSINGLPGLVPHPQQQPQSQPALLKSWGSDARAFAM